MAHDLNLLKSYLLDLRTDVVPHTNSDFYSHLDGVYSYLERWGLPEHVRLAGLFHSLYGTEGFQGFTLSLEWRDQIRSLIGDRAERLVYCYCALTYQSLRESVLAGGGPRLWDRFADCRLEVTQKEYQEILWMMLANTLEIEARLNDEEKTLEQAGFWREVAEELGGVAVEGWEQVYSDALALKKSAAHGLR